MPRKEYKTFTENYQALQFEKMWESIGKFLNPLGIMPDKASLDHEQIFKLYSKLKKMDSRSVDSVQILILKKEVIKSMLQNLVN